MTGRREARFAGFLVALTLAACNFERGGLVAPAPVPAPGGEGEGGSAGGPTRDPGAPIPVPAPPVIATPDAAPAPVTAPSMPVPTPGAPPPATMPPAGSSDARPTTTPPPTPDAGTPPADTAPPVAAECLDSSLRQPVQFTTQRGTPGGDLTFDSNGFMVSLDGRDIVRTARGGRPEMVLANVLPPFSRGGVDGLGMLPDGTVVVADTNGDSLVLSNGPRNQRRSVDINAPGKFLLAPNGNLFITGAQNGELFSVDPATGRSTVIAMTDGRLRGLTYSLDFKTLYMSDSKNRVLLSAKVRPDGTVEPPQVWIRNTGVFPDGMATDICGNVYVSDDSGGPLLRVTPAGKVEMVSALDHNDVAGLAFGSGKQGWDDHTLYAVSDHQGLIYEIKLGIRGAPAPHFTISQ
jgi:hypothetical protein